MDNTQDKREMTYGERAVGLSFNPSQHPGVKLIKEQYAQIIDGLADMREGAKDSETKRLYSVAITEAQTSQMWAVKALTWNL